MSIATRITDPEFLALAWEDPDAHWELFDGEPRPKPVMSAKHNTAMLELAHMIRSQLDPGRFRFRANAGYVRWNERNSFIPDVFVVPFGQFEEQLNRDELERYAEPLPFVVEVWSPSTGEYDRGVKFAAYKARGDAEIWFVHPIARYVQRWVRQEDGAYLESVHERGTVDITSLPGVTVDLDALFAMLD